jgi:serine/threonine protein kinase
MASALFCNHCGSPNQLTNNFCNTCGHQLHSQDASTEPYPQAAGTPLLKQRYRLLDKLGSGGFGTVYRVEDVLHTNRILAAKKLQTDPAASLPNIQMIQQSFMNEASILTELQHPNLPRIHDYFSEAGSSYLIMDFIEGQTLEECLRRVPLNLLPIKDVFWIGIEITNVLEYLHTRQPPIVFRDLKPSNIIITPDRQLFLIDFGIARHFRSDQTSHAENLGTRGYESPEHFSLVTPLSDIYSLGAIMHQLLSGQDPSTYPPFQYPELHLHGLAQTRLETLVMRMLSHEAHERPASAAEVREELQEILEEFRRVNSAPSRRPLRRLQTTNESE